MLPCLIPASYDKSVITDKKCRYKITYLHTPRTAAFTSAEIAMKTKHILEIEFSTKKPLLFHHYH